MIAVEIEVDERGRGKIIVDGVDMSNKVQRIELDSGAMQLTTVRLTLVPCVVRAKAAVCEVETEQPEVEIMDGK